MLSNIIPTELLLSILIEVMALSSLPSPPHDLTQPITGIPFSDFPNLCRNGRWRVVWTYKDGELTGHYKIQVHYYEEGNVQLNTDTTLKVSITPEGSPDAIAQAAQKAVAKADLGYQQSLDASYATMGDTTFKALRRALPITRQKIDWNKIKNYKIGQDVAK
jgi:capping protein alpha